MRVSTCFWLVGVAQAAEPVTADHSGELVGLVVRTVVLLVAGLLTEWSRAALEDWRQRRKLAREKRAGVSDG